MNISFEIIKKELNINNIMLDDSIESFNGEFINIWTLLGLRNVMQRLKGLFPQVPTFTLFIKDDTKWIANSTVLENRNGKITISTGLIYILQNLYYTLFSIPEFKNQIGYTKVENSAINGLNFTYGINGIDLFWGNEVCENLITPRCLDRKRAADTFCLFALNIIVLHEYAHIANGHIEYKIKKTTNGEFTKEIEQSLELDADSFVTNEMFKLGLAHILVPIKDDFQKKHFFKDLDTFTVNYCLVVYGLFRIAAPKPQYYEMVHSGSHPHNLVRASIVNSNIATILRYNYNVPSSVIEKMMTMVIKQIFELEKLFTEVLYLPLNIKAYIYSGTIEGFKYGKRMAKIWGIIRTELSEYSSLPLPQEEDWSADEKDNFHFPMELFNSIRND